MKPINYPGSIYVLCNLQDFMRFPKVFNTSLNIKNGGIHPVRYRGNKIQILLYFSADFISPLLKCLFCENLKLQMK